MDPHVPADKPEEKPRTDRRLDILVGLSAVVLGGVLLIAVFGLPSILAGRDNTEAIRVSDEISACRAERNTVVTDARTTLDEARTRVEVLLAEGLTAVVLEDTETLTRVIGDMADARADVKVATKRLRAATDKYKTAVIQSGERPEAFLADCRHN